MKTTVGRSVAIDRERTEDGSLMNSLDAETLHVILHVPKCAGRTIEMHMLQHLGPNKFWLVPKRSGLLPRELFGKKYRVPADIDLEQVLAISGHLIGRSIEKLFPQRRMVRSIILRDPEDQILSWYNYSMMRYKLRGYKTFPFRVFLRSMPIDPTTYFLLDRWFEMSWLQICGMKPEAKAELIDQELSRFDQVVDISCADWLCAWHCKQLGIPGDPERSNSSAQWRAKSEWRPISLRDLDSTERDELREHVQLDNYLWRRWALDKDIDLKKENVANFLERETVRPYYKIRREVTKALSFCRTRDARYKHDMALHQRMRCRDGSPTISSCAGRRSRSEPVAPDAPHSDQA
jgi:hypothetical protein